MHTATPLLLLALAAPAAAPPAAPSAPVGATFDMTVGGTAYGTEEFSRAEGPESVTLTGKVALSVPGAGAAVLKQTTTLGRDGRPLSYSLDVDASGQQVVLAAAPSDAGFLLSITAKGATEPSQSKTLEAKAPVYLLDNNLPSHLDALTRSLVAMASGEERTITALVPQVMQAIAGSVRRGADGKATLDGQALATRSYRLVVANVGTELISRASDGALLRAEVPMQQAVLNRHGFETVATPPTSAKSAEAPGRGAEDPRERAAAVAGPAVSLPATLLMPKAERPVPAVVFLSGSGPNDQDETIGPNKPFRDLARGLGDRGIASLRFDKRTFAIKDKSKFADVTLAAEYYDDAKAAIALLVAAPGIDPARVFVVGHSEGAMVAPIVAAGSPGIRGIVMMAPGVRPIDTVIIDQLEFGAKMTGLSADDVADQTRQVKDAFAAIRDTRRVNTPPYMGAPASYWREFLALDVPKLVATSKLPILVLQGDQDIQVRKEADFELLRSRTGDTNGRVTFRSFASVNHLFMKVAHESTGAEYAFPGHVEPAVIAAIADWILLR